MLNSAYDTYLYLLLNIGAILVPFLRSFESQVAFYKNFKALFLSIFLVGFFFICWDAFFTSNSIWGFNERYLTGIKIFNLPIEECLFFITVPYSCIFVYEVFKKFLPQKLLSISLSFLTILLIVGSVLVVFVNYTKWYTVSTFSLLAITLMFLHYKRPKWLTLFYVSFLVCLIPFFLMNGVLTGSGIEDEIVWYNNMHFMGLRMWTIPVEDTFYGMLLLILNVTLFENFKQK